jgi:hypothetical protein
MPQFPEASAGGSCSKGDFAADGIIPPVRGEISKPMPQGES